MDERPVKRRSMKESCTIKGLAISVGIFALVLAAVFTVVWVREAYDYEAQATVTGLGTTKFTCSVQKCKGTGADKHCTTHYYGCWSAFWNVTYAIAGGEVISSNVTEESKYEDKIKAEQDTDEYKVNNQYELWYNKADPVLARWISPKPGLFLGLMIIGWAAVGGALITGIVAECRAKKPGYAELIN